MRTEGTYIDYTKELGTWQGTLQCGDCPHMMTSSEECPRKPVELSGHKREDLEELATWVVKEASFRMRCTHCVVLFLTLWKCAAAGADRRPAVVKG